MPPTENITVNLLPKPTNEVGMTLIELLVVLGILAALAGMTLSLVGEMNNSSRQDVTKNKLDQIESAIIGEPTHYSRFLSDMGRLPVKIDGEGKEFSELWDGNLFEDAEEIQIDYAGYKNDISTIFDDTISVTLNAGWKGPYLNVPSGKLYDGFGNNFWIAEKSDDVNDTTLWDFFNQSFNPSDNTKKLTIIKFGSQDENDKREINSSVVLSTLHVKILLRDSSTDQITWLPPSITNDSNGYKKYANAQGHYYGDIVLPETILPNNGEANDLFICLPTISPTSATESVWTRFNIVETKYVQQDVTLLNYWRWLSHSHKLNRMRVVVFSPYISQSATKDATVRITTASYDYNNSTSDTWTFNDALHDNNTTENPFAITNESSNQKHINEVTISNLVPGIRKILVYGYVANEESKTHSNAHRSNIQTIELKPGENFITIYLNENIP